MSLQKKFKAAKGTVAVYVDPASGKLASDGCPVKRLTLFAAGTEPTEYCTDHLDHEEHKEEKA